MRDDPPTPWDPRQFTFTAWPAAPEATVPRCAWGLRFWQWCERLEADVADALAAAPTRSDTPLVRLNQALFSLQDGYFSHRAKAPAEHQDCLGSADHVCLYQVYVETYEYLLARRLQLQPPLLVATAPASEVIAEEPDVARKPALPGMWLGDLIEEDA